MVDNSISLSYRSQPALIFFRIYSVSEIKDVTNLPLGIFRYLGGFLSLYSPLNVSFQVFHFLQFLQPFSLPCSCASHFYPIFHSILLSSLSGMMSLSLSTPSIASKSLLWFVLNNLLCRYCVFLSS